MLIVVCIQFADLYDYLLGASCRAHPPWELDDALRVAVKIYR